MPRISQELTGAMGGRCGIARSLGVLSDPWSFLLLREAYRGNRTFAQFRDSLGIASDVLTARLNSLIHYGVMMRVAYKEPGQRTRDAYELTDAGEKLKVVLVALQQWGEDFLPVEQEPAVLPMTIDTHDRVYARLVSSAGVIEHATSVQFFRGSDTGD
ncbi:winged helix-turn-helix transcriptional regulator [Glutamicibacter sp. AOP5-A2-18]|uniref:winged helix-turn-helix transcriptional regulator n=1 Tax=Glutamicibacter sp. AOP5-A2-18 TaxID=3457656 RepID=UPI00403344A2